MQTQSSTSGRKHTWKHYLVALAIYALLIICACFPNPAALTM